MRFTVPILLLVLTCIAGRAQSQPTFEQRATLDSSFGNLLRCLQTKQVSCLTSAISNRGVAIGVDGPRVSKHELRVELASDPKIQCLFWGSGCKSEPVKCSILSLAARPPKYGKPYVYEKSWQAEVRTKGTRENCPAEASFIFQLEKGVWKVVAIPYT